MFEVSQARQNLARLLATENISVMMNSTAPTAYFDVKNRMLVVPNWKIDDTTLVMLLAHEVGHARFTPMEGWHTTIKNSDLPKLMQTILNVCEDPRIEKLMQRQYRGLKRDFVEGYKFLSDLDKFGNVAKMTKPQIKKAGFVDRINLEFKFGSIIPVPFTKAEQKLVDEVASTETFEDVVKVSLKIFAKVSKNLPNMEELMKALAESMKMSSEELQKALRDAMKERSGSDSGSDSGEEEGETLTISSSEGGGKAEGEESDSEDQDAGGSGAGQGEDSDEYDDIKTNDEDTSITEKLEQGISSIETSRYGKTRIVDVNNGKDFDFKTASKEVVNRYLISGDVPQTFSKTIEKTANIVNQMVGVFQQKQAAKALARIRESKTGTINCSKISQYKISDDIFLKNSEVPNGKNHGVVLVLDMSGSMNNIFANTVRQMIMVTEFCRKLKVPYQVYGVNDQKSWKDVYTLSADGKTKTPPADYRPGYLIPLWSSRESRSDQIQAMNAVGTRGKSLLGGTPLNRATLSLIGEVDRFKKQTKAEIIDIIYLTDGGAGDNTIFLNETVSDVEYGEIKNFQDSLRILRLKQKVNVTNLNLVNGAPTYRSWNETDESFAKRQADFWKPAVNKDGFSTWINIDSNVFGFREKVTGDDFDSIEESFSAGAEMKKGFRKIMSLVAGMIAEENFIMPVKKVDATPKF